MFKNLIKIPTLDMSREEWLMHRRKSIGGSDAAAIVGMNPWASPYSVWADKLGKLPEKEDTESMRLGRDLEDYVAKRFTEATGKKVRRENAIITNPDFPFAHANVDRMVVGEDAGLECKTTRSLNVKQFKNGEFPDNYYAQCVHYMMVTGASKWYLAVLVLGEGFYWYCIERDEAEIESLDNAEQEFWYYVESNTPPVTDGNKATTETLSMIYADSNPGSTMQLFGCDTYLREYLDLGNRIKVLKEQQDEVANKVKATMGETEKGASDSYKVSWTSSKRETFDSKAFLADHPEINTAPYMKVTATRAFKVSEIKKK